MSSIRKDARWQLAVTVSESLGIDFYNLPYEQSQGLLTAANGFLDSINDTDVELRLSNTWNQSE